MEANKDIKDNVLGRWIAGELSEEERISFEASDAFKTYDAIARYSNELETPEFNSEKIYGQINTKIDKKKSRIVNFSFYKKIVVAASILMLIGVGALYMIGSDPTIETTSIETAQGETKTIALPDNSEVQLNVASSISYSKDSWDEARTIKLTGEAFFKVKKGKRFVVKTDQGNIEVLGTSFNIRVRNDIMEVVCYTGKVQVTSPKGRLTILKKGDATRIVNGKHDNQLISYDTEAPAWQNGFSQFDNVPLESVIEELENQYNVEINCKTDISNRTYVGSFPHDNLEQALKLITEPMQLEGTINNDTLIVIQ